jgi:hypothetical protein
VQRFDITDETIGAQIGHSLYVLNLRTAHVFGISTPAKMADVEEMRSWLKAAIGGALGEARGMTAAHKILNDLIDPYESMDAAFWTTALGKAVAWWTGGPLDPDGVPRPIVAAILGCSRQNIFTLVKEGKLAEKSPGMLTQESVRAAMRQRHPHQIKEG